jgi:hypothetical protein
LFSTWLFPSCSPTTSLLCHIHHMPHDFHPHWSLKSLVCVQTQTDLPVQFTHNQQVLLRLHMADCHHCTFHYSKFLTKLNKHHRMLLVILYVMLWSTAFLTMFSIPTLQAVMTKTKRNAHARAHPHTLFMKI